jgi:hypothetical protein
MPLLEDKSVIPEGFIGNPESYPLGSRFRGNDNPKYVKLTMKHYTSTKRLSWPSVSIVMKGRESGPVRPLEVRSVVPAAENTGGLLFPVPRIASTL